jgi:hypothetical protein
MRIVDCGLKDLKPKVNDFLFIPQSTIRIPHLNVGDKSGRLGYHDGLRMSSCWRLAEKVMAGGHGRLKAICYQ